jgi:hypothetical protein
MALQKGAMPVPIVGANAPRGGLGFHAALGQTTASNVRLMRYRQRMRLRHRHVRSAHQQLQQPNYFPALRSHRRRRQVLSQWRRWLIPLSAPQ